MNELSIAELSKMSKIASSLKKMISWKTIKNSLRGTANFILTSYFLGINLPSPDEITKIEINTTISLYVVSFIALYLFINFFFYTVIEYGLRYFFHGYIKDKITNQNFGGKRSQVETAREYAQVIRKFIIRPGLLHSAEFNIPLDVSKIDTEKEFNNEMKEFYLWIILGLHSLTTIILVWKFFTWWLLLICILLLGFIILITIAKAFIVLNPGSIELVRRFIERENIRRLQSS